MISASHAGFANDPNVEQIIDRGIVVRSSDRSAQGASYTLQGLHDVFLALGPLPLIWRAMLGQAGEVFPVR